MDPEDWIYRIGRRALGAPGASAKQTPIPLILLILSKTPDVTGVTYE